MPPSQSEDGPVELTSPHWFATTHWSVVLAAKEGDAPSAATALEKLCRAYWPPLYAYIRREGHDATAAQDLTQEFFARLLERDYLARLDQQRGKFRSFLLAFVKHFLSEQREKAGAQKRGGGQALLSLDAGEGEEGYLSEPVDELTPEQIFERRWVQTLLQRAFDRLAPEYVKGDKAALFEALKDFQPVRLADLRANRRRLGNDRSRRQIRHATPAPTTPRDFARGNRADGHFSQGGRRGDSPHARGVEPLKNSRVSAHSNTAEVEYPLLCNSRAKRCLPYS
jgi:RNA polymerase sigma factor (sigma-70 family)